MRILIFGASGMIGRGVLRECLLDTDVIEVKVVGRSAMDASFHIPSPKFSELVMPDLFDYSSVEHELTGFDACFFCLGTSAKEMRDAVQYERITYTLTVTAAQVLARLNPQMTIAYVSGAGTNSSEQSRTVWMRVKGKTENALLALPFKHAVMFRPVLVQPMNGEEPKNGMYRIFYAAAKPFIGTLRKLFPKQIVTTEQMGRAMLSVVKHDSDKNILESVDIGRF